MFIAILVILALTVILSPFIIGAILLMPHAVMIVKRRITLKRLADVANGAGFEVHSLRRVAYFSSNRSEGYDLLFLSKERAFAVKLWSAFSPDRLLFVAEDGSYREGRRIPEVMSENKVEKKHYVLHGSVNPAPITKRNFKVRPAVTVDCVLLYFPPYRSARMRVNGKIEDIRDGARLWGKTVYSPDGFADLLAKSGEKETEQRS